MRLPAACALLLLLPATALADEYTVTSFTGGYESPPPGAALLLGADEDDTTAAVDLPFEFPYFGRLFTRVSVCSNGWLAFGSSTATTGTNPELPDSAAPDGVVAPLWDDLTTRSGSVVTFTLGSAPNRTFVVSWEGVDTFSATENDDMSFQVRLDEADGAIEIAYATTGTWDGLSFTAGIEDPTGTIAFGGPGTGNTNSGQPAVDQRFEPATSTVSGVVLRDRPVADATGLGNTFETGLPVSGTDVVVRRGDDGQVAARARTDATGAWSATVYGIEAPSAVSVALNASGAAARVTDAASAVYAHDLATLVTADPTVDLGTQTLDAATDAASPAFREALNIQQAAERGRAYAIAAAEFAGTNAVPPRAPETFDALEFRFVDGSGVSGYVPATPSSSALATISDVAANPDAYDDDVVLREYAQHVLATIAVHPNPFSSRSWSAATGHVFAFTDGFAHWFAAVVQERSVFIDTTAESSALTFDLEGPDPAPEANTDGEQVTAAVAASLWELVDPANEPEDEFAGTTGAPPSTAADVLATIDIALDTQTLTAIEIRDFFDAWRAGGADVEREQTARAFIHHGTLLDDTFEPNDRQGEAGDPGQGMQKVENLVLSPFNEDHFTVVLGSMAVLTVSVQQTSNTDLDVSILDAGGATVAFASNQGLTEGRDVVAASTAAEVPPGTYTARVVWRGGETGNYSLSYFDPFDLLTTSLPEWTAGVAFKEDLFATGGVEPYTFMTSTDAPGLSATGGTRVDGTPTAAGDFFVDVTVSDSAAPPNQVQAAVPLRINAALALTTLLGVPEQRELGFDVGTGGTATSWVVGDSPPGALSLAGGATLRLSGTASAPGAFEISGSATDSVGAALNETTATIVVTGDLAATTSATVPPQGLFGFFFDGLANSASRLSFRFRGTGEDPAFVAVLDSAGNEVVGEGDPRVGKSARRARISGFVLPATDRYHVIFESGGFDGDVLLRSTVRPPRRGRGQVAIEVPEAIVDIPFEALGGSVMTVRVQRSPSPLKLRPRVDGIRDPGGNLLMLPAQRILRRRGAARQLPRTLLPIDGTYLLRLSGDGSTTGPLFYRYRIVAPRGARFVAD